MPLPSSGQISFDNVRTEVSQSAMTDYKFSGWASGRWSGKSASGSIFAPINVLSSGSRFSVTNRLISSNLSMSAWYSYNHTASISASVTGTLYSHANPYSFSRSLNDTRANDETFVGVRSMLPINLGTTNATYSINVSGSPSASTLENIEFWYGTPWDKAGRGGAGFWPGTSITGAQQLNGVFSFQYNYTYNASSGSTIYAVIISSKSGSGV
jgi:hypothetical protein